jgi:hypothetical protein
VTTIATNLLGGIENNFELPMSLFLDKMVENWDIDNQDLVMMFANKTRGN